MGYIAVKVHNGKGPVELEKLTTEGLQEAKHQAERLISEIEEHSSRGNDMEHNYDHEPAEIVIDYDEDGDGTEMVRVCTGCGAHEALNETEAIERNRD